MGKSFVTTFSYDCELAFNSVDGTSTEILPEWMKYIAIEHDYANKIMPVIYIKVNINPTLYNKMVPEQGKSKIYAKIMRTRKKGSTSSSAKKVIYDEFDYYMSDDPNGYKKLDTISEESGNSYKTCFIGLVKMDLQTKNQVSFEGVYKNTNAASMIQSATSSMKMVMQPFDNNKNISSFVCPNVSSVGQFVSYVNSKSSLYNGSFTYYMDFDKTYLRSNDGSYIDAQDNDFKYIAFDIRDLTAHKALVTGIVEDEEQDAYIIYVRAQDAQVAVDRVTSSLVSNVDVIDASNQSVSSATVDTSAVTNIIGNPNAKTVSVSTDANAATNKANTISESSNVLSITKLDMDSKIFTPNKQYLLCNYEDNPKYCGVYYLTGKKELYLRIGEKMNCQIILTLKKCGELS